MPLIPDGFVDEIQSRTDIAELVGRYVPLKRSGRNFKALCPFHKEKSPSFMVNADKQIFHCFGCGVGGNIFGFLMQHDRLSFPEAVHQLADAAGLTVPSGGLGPASNVKTHLLTLMDKVCDYYERVLQESDDGHVAREYVNKRGVDEATRQFFRMGAAPAGWDKLIKAAKTKGVSAEKLEEVGLVVRNERFGYRDRFRNRFIFPIMDVRSRVIGFGGRSLDEQQPKYLNSPETPVYSKGKHLYGLAQAKEAILKSRVAIIVEGYFDCVVLSGSGIKNVVSPLGTALTIEQVRLLKRYADTIVLAFDPDAAGEAATLHGIDRLIEVGLRVQIARLPSGMDPDECLRHYGREKLEQWLNEGKNIFEFLMDVAAEKFNTKESEGAVQAAHFVLPIILKVKSAILRSEYVRKLADRFRLDEAAVAQDLADLPGKKNINNTQNDVTYDKSKRYTSNNSGPERLLTALILDDNSRWEMASQKIRVADIQDPVLRRILAINCELFSTHNNVSPAQIASRLTEEGLGSAVSALVELAQPVSEKDSAMQDCCLRIQENVRKRQLKQLQEAIETAQKAGDDSEVQRLLAEYQRQVKGG